MKKHTIYSIESNDGKESKKELVFAFSIVFLVIFMNFKNNL